jgi:hypothetical protein
MNGPAWNIAGLIIALFGILILFRYGMPFHVPSGGATHIIGRNVDQKEIALEKRYTIYGYFGLAFIIIGTAAQIYASWLELHH